MDATSNSREPYRTGKRRLARFLVGTEIVLLGRMFLFPPTPDVITALGPYFTAFSALVAGVVIAHYGLASYVNQIIPAQRNGIPNA